MKQKLILTSQGIQPELKDMFLANLIKSPSETSVAFITTAAYGEEKDPQWLNVYRIQLRQFGITDIRDVDIKDMKSAQLERVLRDRDIIFVNGGNTFYLLKYVRESGFDKLLPKLLGEGKIYIGVSAGSYIPCPTIEAAVWKNPDRNKVGLKDLTGLNLVPFLITAHFEEKYRAIVEKASRNTKYPVVALRDTQAILVDGNNYKLVGKGEKEFFNGFTERSKTKNKV